MKPSSTLKRKKIKRKGKTSKKRRTGTCRGSFVWICAVLLAGLLMWWGVQALYDSSADTPIGPSTSEDFHFAQAFDFTWPSHTPKDMILEEKNFTIAYDKQHRGPIWAAYIVKKTNLSKPEASHFVPDSRLPLRLRLALRRKPKAPFGHYPLIVNEELATTEDIQNKLKLQRNLTLQLSDFYENIWKKLALYTCKWAEKYGPLYVVSGEVYDGRQNTRVPRHFYKVVLLLKDNQQAAIAFLIPHKAKPETDIFQFAQSVDQLEEQLRMDFFPRTPQELQSRVEASMDPAFWK